MRATPEVQLEVREWGAGSRNALLVHGLYQDSLSWYRLGPSLADLGYHVVAPDLRGHGDSPRADRYSPTDWALDLVDSFRGARFDVAIGHSLGGLTLAVAAHALRPARVLYLDPAWRMSPGQDAEARAEWLRWLQWTDPAQMRERLGPDWDDEDLRLTWEALQRTDPAVVPGLATGAGYDFSAEAADEPTLVLAADPSEFITVEHAARLRDRGVAVEVAEGTGHSWFREDYASFWARVRAWLRESSQG